MSRSRKNKAPTDAEFMLQETLGELTNQAQNDESSARAAKTNSPLAIKVAAFLFVALKIGQHLGLIKKHSDIYIGIDLLMTIGIGVGLFYVYKGLFFANRMGNSNREAQNLQTALNRSNAPSIG